MAKRKPNVTGQGARWVAQAMARREKQSTGNNLSAMQFGGYAPKHAGSFSQAADVTGVAKQGGIARGKHSFDMNPYGTGKHAGPISALRKKSYSVGRHVKVAA